MTARKVSGATSLDWTAVPNATNYEVVKGLLANLRTTGGDFSVAVNSRDGGVQGTTRAMPEAPAPGQVWFYVIRGAGCGCGVHSTWDDDDNHHRCRSRDAGIGGSPHRCN